MRRSGHHPGPPGDVAPEDWQRAVLGTMAPFVADVTHTLLATQVVDGNATLRWSVPTEKVLA